MGDATDTAMDAVQRRLMFEDECILVDENDRVVGHDSKYNCHLMQNQKICCIELSVYFCLTQSMSCFFSNDLQQSDLDSFFPTWILSFASLRTLSTASWCADPQPIGFPFTPMPPIGYHYLGKLRKYDSFSATQTRSSSTLAVDVPITRSITIIRPNSNICRSLSLDTSSCPDSPSGSNSTTPRSPLSPGTPVGDYKRFTRRKSSTNKSENAEPRR